MSDDDKICQASLVYVVNGSNGEPHKCTLPAGHEGAHRDALSFSWTGYPFHVVTR